jgi:hypothetical protein
MRTRTPGAGRRSKGPREVMTTRLPTPLADALRQRAEDNGLSFSEEIANAVATVLGHPPVAAPRQQEQVKLPA